ncbi:MAG: hypothetical protein HEQ32_06835 [Vampirovibrio sp.]
MPRYAYICENSACLQAFDLERSAESSHLITFCPSCASLATRDPQDYQRIHIQGLKATLPQEAFEAPPASEEITHVHGASCGCALKKDWHRYVNARLNEKEPH